MASQHAEYPGSNIWSIPQSEHPRSGPYIIYIYIYIYTYIYVYHLCRVDFHCQPGTNRGHIMTYPYLFQACCHPPFFQVHLPSLLVKLTLRPKHTSKTCVASNGSQDNIFQGYPATTIGPSRGPTNLVSKSGWCHWHVWELTKKNDIKWMKLRILDEIGSCRMDLPKRIKNKTRTPAVRGQSCKKGHWLEQTTAWT